MAGWASICAISPLWKRSRAPAPSARPRVRWAIPSRPSASRSRSSSGSSGGSCVREQSSAADLLRLLEHGELDLTFADLPLREGPFEWAELLQDPYVLLVSARSELAELDSAPSLRDVAKLPLIGRRTTDEPERFLAGRVPGLNIIFRTDDNGTLGALVAEDLGGAIEPR